MLISQRNNLNIYTSIEELETVKTKICNANNIVRGNDDGQESSW